MSSVAIDPRLSAVEGPVNRALVHCRSRSLGTIPNQLDRARAPGTTRTQGGCLRNLLVEADLRRLGCLWEHGLYIPANGSEGHPDLLRGVTFVRVAQNGVKPRTPDRNLFPHSVDPARMCCTTAAAPPPRPIRRRSRRQSSAPEPEEDPPAETGNVIIVVNAVARSVTVSRRMGPPHQDSQ